MVIFGSKHSWHKRDKGAKCFADIISHMNSDLRFGMTEYAFIQFGNLHLPSILGYFCYFDRQLVIVINAGLYRIEDKAKKPLKTYM